MPRFRRRRPSPDAEHLFHLEVALRTGAVIRLPRAPNQQSDAFEAMMHAMTEEFRNARGRAVVLPAGGNIEWISPFIKVRQHRLDVKYPHRCFKCKKPLLWLELYDANVDHVVVRRVIYSFDSHLPVRTYHCLGLKWNFKAYKRLKKLWRSQVVEFYCCFCFKKMNDPNKDEPERPWFLRQEYEADFNLPQRPHPAAQALRGVRLDESGNLRWFEERREGEGAP